MMVVADSRFAGQNAERPQAGADWVSSTCASWGSVRTSLWQGRGSHKAPESATGEFVLMNRKIRPMHAPKQLGLERRARLRELVLARLRPGCRIPSSAFLGRLLGVSPTSGYWHMRWVLEEAGVTTETRGVGETRRVYVVALPDSEGRAAA